MVKNQISLLIESLVRSIKTRELEHKYNNLGMNKKQMLFEEIKILTKDIENVNFEIISQKEELQKSVELLEQRKKEKEEFIRQFYSKTNINNGINEALKALEDLLKVRYKSKFIPVKADLEKQIKLEIFIRDFYTIISSFNYKHKSNKLRFVRFLNFIIYGLLAFAVVFIGKNYLYERDYFGEKHLTWFGWFAFAVVFILFFASFIQLILISSILGRTYRKKIIAIKTEELSQKIDYLNSLHKIPEEIKTIVTHNYYQNGK